MVIPTVKFAEVNSGMCHSCGACLFACKYGAIEEIPHLIGRVNYYNINSNTRLLEGELSIGSAMQTMLIKELKKRVSDENEIIVYDAPPGTSCPVVETIIDSNYVVLVSEPTPFGMNDLKLMVDLMSEVKKPFGVIVNKAGLGNYEIYEYMNGKGIELLGKIPFNKLFAASYAEGELTKYIPDEVSESIDRIMDKLEGKIVAYEGDNYFKW